MKYKQDKWETEVKEGRRGLMDWKKEENQGVGVKEGRTEEARDSQSNRGEGGREGGREGGVDEGREKEQK